MWNFGAVPQPVLVWGGCACHPADPRDLGTAQSQLGASRRMGRGLCQLQRSWRLFYFIFCFLSQIPNLRIALGSQIPGVLPAASSPICSPQNPKVVPRCLSACKIQPQGMKKIPVRSREQGWEGNCSPRTPKIRVGLTPDWGWVPKPLDKSRAPKGSVRGT